MHPLAPWSLSRSPGPSYVQQTKGLHLAQKERFLSNWSVLVSLQLLHTLIIASESELARHREHILDTGNSICKGPGVSGQMLLMEEAGIPLPIFSL